MSDNEKMDVSFNGRFTRGVVAFNSITEVQNIICNWNKPEIKLMISGSKRYGKTFVFLMGCLIILGTQYNKNVRLWLPNKMMRHFEKMNILDYYQRNQNTGTEISQTFFQLKEQADVYALVNNIVKNLPVGMTEKLKEVLISKIGEMYNNAVDHAQANYIMGGRYSKSRKNGKTIFCFSCYDTGIGIINSVKNFTDMTGSQWNNFETNKKILMWALKKGNSTKVDISRGLGLDLLLSFARLNKGIIRICSENVVFKQDAAGNRKYYKLDKNFKGTLFEMEVISDTNAIYCLKGE